MNQRKILSITLVTLIFIGIGSVIFIFSSSLKPNSKAIATDKLFVSLKTFEEKNVVAIDWQNYKVLLVESPTSITGFLIPYQNDIYYLPDPTWDQAIVKCRQFEISSIRFSCTDPTLSEAWRRAAQWGVDGRPIRKTWIPALEKAPIKIVGSNIEISNAHR